MTTSLRAGSAAPVIVRSRASRVGTVLFHLVIVLTAGVATLGVTAAGFALSFDAVTSVAVAARIRPSLAWLMPVTIDGAIAVATIAAIVLRAMGQSTAYPWSVVGIGAATSVLCNGLHALTAGGALQLPASVAAGIGAIPAINLALSVHLVVLLVAAISHSLRDSTATSLQSAAGVAAPDSPTDATDDGVVATPTDCPRRTAPQVLESVRQRDKSIKTGSKVAAMRSHWDTSRAAGHTPTGAELAEIAGAHPSLGRRKAAEWQAEPSLVASGQSTQ